MAGLDGCVNNVAQSGGAFVATTKRNYITAGSLNLGGEQYGVGDGFFVPQDVPYTGTARPERVELLEFRNDEKFDVVLRANGRHYWEKATSRIVGRRSAWSDESKPSARYFRELHTGEK